MAAHQLTRGIWVKIEPRPAMVQGAAPRVEVLVSASEPDLLDTGLELTQCEPTEIPAGAGDLWCRIHPSSAYATGTLQTLEAAPAEA